MNPETPDGTNTPLDAVLPDARPTLQRRRLLALMGTAAALGGTSLPVLASTSAIGADHALLRRQWRDLLTGGSALAGAPAPLAAVIAERTHAAVKWWEATRTTPMDRLYAELDHDRVHSSRVVCERLRQLALAWATPGNPLHGDAEVAARIGAAIEWFAAHRYHVQLPRVGNWWEWEIGIPMALLDLLLLADGLAPAGTRAVLLDAVRHFSGDPLRSQVSQAGHPLRIEPTTAANRVWKSQVTFLAGLLAADTAWMDEGRAAFASTLVWSPQEGRGDGFHRDGSFIQHGHFAYTGGYGVDMLVRASALAHMLRGSAWQLGASEWETLAAWALQAYVPWIEDGIMMDAVRGRNLSRSYSSAADAGQLVTGALVLVALGTPGATGRALRPVVKSLLVGKAGEAFFAPGAQGRVRPGPEVLLRAHALMRDGAVQAAPRQVRTWQFTAMDRLVHRRARFTLTLAMQSERIGSHESINGENGTGWYQGAGMLALYPLQDGRQDHYGDAFWPTVDPQRLAGVTVARRSRGFGEGSGALGAAPTGAASLEQAAVACMHLRDRDGGLSGRKAWFLFGDAVLAAGAGLTGTAGHPVETVIENRAARDAAPALVLGPAEGGQLGWAHVEGAGGIVFPVPAAVSTLQEARSGRWSDINRAPASDRTLHTRHYTTVWLAHGKDPRDAAYAYVRLPGASVDQTRAFSREAPLRLLHNSAACQAAELRSGSTRTFGAVFWEAGECLLGSATAPLCLVGEARAGDVALALSDPTRAAAAHITVRLALAGARLVEAAPTLAVLCRPDHVEIVLDARRSNGQPQRLRLAV